jgi:hypothetical protein
MSDIEALEAALAAFAVEHAINSKGALCLPLVVTDHARHLGLPLDSEQLKTGKEGQVLGLGKGKVQAILARHGIDRVLAEEGGRTSRGSLGKMRAYVDWLNTRQTVAPLDLDAVERFWISRVQAFFAAKPFVLRLDPTLSLQATLEDLFAQAAARQREMSGTMVVGTVMQHIVGAKLELRFGAEHIQHHSASTNDAAVDRPGDFALGDLAVHVSTAPGEALIRKCQSNLQSGQRPVIITGRRGQTLALGLAENFNIANRLDVFEVGQWLAAEIIDRGGVSRGGRGSALSQLLDAYNRIVAQVETDPSLRVEFAGSD